MALLTAERARELIAMPKRLVKRGELAWRPLTAPVGDAPPTRRQAHHRILRARLIGPNREVFQIDGTSNRTFRFALKWGNEVLVRLCCAERHRIPSGLGGGAVRGPHLYYYVPGYGTKYAEASGEFSCDDVNGALQFFLQLSNVTDGDSIQETMVLR